MTGNAQTNPTETIRGHNSLRRSSPVFVTGCHRSGTNLLYDILLSSGGFAVYRGYIPIYKTLVPRFGSLENVQNRKKIFDTWIRSKGFVRAELNAEELTSKLLVDCRTGGEFLRIIMSEIARKQNANRWAVYDPDNLLHIPSIKADIPNALFIHIIRDGRDIALSLKKMGGFTPFPWKRESRSLRETALYWEWMVRRGRTYGSEIPADYIEIHYEDLVRDPEPILAKLSRFLDHDIHFERVKRDGFGRKSNSSFQVKSASESPVNRWKHRLSPKEVLKLERQIGSCLVEFGYTLTVGQDEGHPRWWQTWMSFAYRSFLDTKFWVKHNTPLRRLASLAELELSEHRSRNGEEPSMRSNSPDAIIKGNQTLVGESQTCMRTAGQQQGSVSVIVPVFNEVTNLGEILRAIRASSVKKEIIIIDDGSTDGTRERLLALPSSDDLTIAFHEKNCGKGAAIRTALAYARGEYVLIQDSDLEYDPQDYAALLQPLERGETNVVYGVRPDRPERGLRFYLGAKLLTHLANLLYGAGIQDEATGYKVFRRSLLSRVRLECRRFEFCPEITAKVCRMGEKISEVPISYTPRSTNEGKKIRNSDGWMAIWTLIRYRFSSSARWIGSPSAECNVPFPVRLIRRPEQE